MAWEKDFNAGQLALVRGVFDEAERKLLMARESAAAFGPTDTAWAEVNRALAQLYVATDRPTEAESAAREALATDELYWGSECEQVAKDCFLVGEALRLQWDFERARPWFERCVQFRDQYFGTTHDTTMEAMARLLLVHLQSKSHFGLEQLQAKVYEAYQTTHPSGMWATFLKLHEVATSYVRAGKEHDLQDLLHTEAQLLRKQLGSSHKEVASVLAVEAEVLKKAKRELAAWSVGTKAHRVERANNLSLFASDERTYKLPASQAEEAICMLLGRTGAGDKNAPEPLHHARWQVDRKSSPQDSVGGTLAYFDGETSAELKLTARVQPRGPTCSMCFEWQLSNSSNMALAKSVTAYTIKDLDDNLNVIPAALNLPAGFSSGAIAQAAAGPTWPTPQQFNEAVQNPRTALSDVELKESAAESNALGLPKPYSGSFATVYRLTRGESNSAVKCFTTNVPDQQTRYAAISEELVTLKLPYFVSFEYQATGINIGGAGFPILKMNWVHGQALIPYIQANLSDGSKLDKLAMSVLKMVNGMQAAGIAHGDLQHGNIIIVNEEVRLVDYDGMYVPALAGRESNELGHRNYQHPQRNAQMFNERLDNFSSWVIYCSLICLSRAPQFWSLLQAGDESLLFKQADFSDPNSSNSLRLLSSESDPDIKSTMRFFNDMVRMKANEIPSVSEVFGQSAPS